MAYFGTFFSVGPAYAGMILRYGVHTYAVEGRPRVCGDDPLFCFSVSIVHQ